MIQDKDTNIVYFSSKLNEWKKFKDFYQELTSLLDELEILYERIYDTKDIWVRDFMPIQIDENAFLKYKYEPDYLIQIEKNRPYITDCTTACCKKGIKCCRNTDIIIDGGNVVLCGDKIVMTEKVFTENKIEVGDVDFLHRLEEVFEHKIVIIPWHATGKLGDEEADVYGQSDGFIKYCRGNRILMSNHRETDKDEAIAIRNKLEENGYEVTEMLFDVENPQPEWNWAYINFLQIGNNIILPKFGIAEDEQAKKYVQDAFPDCRIRQIDCRLLAKDGGALHCISWNIKK